MGDSLEANSLLELDFEKLLSVVKGELVIPVVVQHVETKAVLILAYVSRGALSETMRRGIAVFWSTSRQELWVKGETSGDYLDVKAIQVNCEENSLLFLVVPRQGGVCHVKDGFGNAYPTCFYRTLDGQIVV